MEYQVAISEVEEQRVVSIRERRRLPELAQFLAASFADLFGRLGLLGERPAGPPFIIYHEFGTDMFDAEVCVPVTGPVQATGRLQTRVIPAMTVARTIHTGPYETIGEAHRALAEWARQRGIDGLEPTRERYLVGPADTARPDEYRTEVELPIVEAAVSILA